jgi:hypothetical protein
MTEKKVRKLSRWNGGKPRRQPGDDVILKKFSEPTGFWRGARVYRK